MRVSTSQIFDSSVQSMNSSLTEAVKYQQQISSGQSYSKASDNPYAVSWGVRLSFDKSRLTMYSNNQNYVTASMDSASTQLGSMVDAMNQLTSVSVQAQNGSLTPSALNALYQQASQIAKTIQGQATAKDASGNPIFPSSINSVQIEPGVSVDSGILTSDAFGKDLNGLSQADLASATDANLAGKTDVLAKINQFVAYLGHKAGISLYSNNTSTLTDVSSGLTSAYNQLQDAQTHSGLVGSLVSQASSAVNSLSTQLASTTSTLLDTDMAAATAGFTKNQAILNAAQVLFGKLQSSDLFSKL
jgi:flagellin-like hook-associated protein FlgL